MEGLDLTILELTEKNKRIRSRIKGQGINFEEHEVRGAGSSKKSLGNLTRLSYGTWAGQNFLSSTHLSTSMNDFVTEGTTPGFPSGTKKKKIKKKTKVKMHTAISFSSEEEELSAKKPLETKVRKGTESKKVTPSTSRATLQPLTDNAGSSHIRSQVDIGNKKKSVSKSKNTPSAAGAAQTSNSKTGAAHVPAIAKQITESHPKKSKGKPATKVADLSTETSRPAVLSGVERISLLWGMNRASDNVESEGSVCPDSSYSSQACSLSISSQASQSVISKKSKIKKQPAKKKANKIKAKPSILRNINFSSESDSEIERNKEKIAEFRKQQKNKSIMQSILASSDESRQNKTEDGTSTTNKSLGASSVDIKRFVMDTDSDHEEKIEHGENIVIPCTQDIEPQHPESGESMEEAYVTIPCSQEEELMRDETHVPCTQTQTQVKEARRCEDGVTVIPDSEAIDSEETNNSGEKEENVVFVAATESFSNDKEMIEPVSGIDTIPCSQDVVEHIPSPKRAATDDSVISVQDTPHLVNVLRDAVNAALNSSDNEILPSLDKIPPRSQLPAQNSKKKTTKGKAKPQNIKQKPKGRKNLFEAFQFSSDEGDVKENCPETPVCLVTDSAISNDSSSLSNYNETNATVLSQRLQNILQKSQKKKRAKDKKKTKTGPFSKRIMNFSSSSCESSHGGQRSERADDDLIVPDSQTVLSNKTSKDNVSVVEDSLNPNILVPDSESVGIEIEDLPDITIPESQDTNLGLIMSVSAASPPSQTPSIENTVRYFPARESEKSKPASKEKHCVISESEEEYSPELPVFQKPKINHPLQMENDLPKKVNMSLQVSMMSPMTDDGMEKSVAEQHNISLQVSITEEEGSGNENEGMDGRSEQSASDADQRNRSDFFTPPEKSGVNVSDWDKYISPHTSPEMLPFSTQVSLPSVQEDPSIGAKDGEGVSYDGLNFSEKSIEISMETDVVRNLVKDLAIDGNEDDQSDFDSGELDHENSGDESDGVQAGVGNNMSLQVSMCVDAVMEESEEEEVEGRNAHPTSQYQIPLQDSDEDVPRPSLRNKRKPVILEDSSSDSNYEIIDDTDEDPDFDVSTKKSAKGTKTQDVTKQPTPKPKSRGSNKSDSSNKNYTEAQPIRTVLLCEKKESVKGFDPETDEDDYELPDITPPQETTPHQLNDSSDDNFDAFIEEMKNRKKEKDKKARENKRSLDDFIVDDDDVTSDEDDNEGFYSRTSRELEKTRNNRIRSDGSDSVFKTPGKSPARQNFKTPKPGPSRIQVKHASKTPAPGRVHQLVNLDDDLRSNSTGHLPVFHGFLKSLSSDVDDKQRHPEARRYVKDFKKLKEELTKKLFKLYNDTVFAHELPADLSIQWNGRLTTTAGFCAYKRDRSMSTGRTCRVELSVKVCDSAERVRDTLVHELCHAAVWLIYGKNDGHGRYWQTLASKAMRIHPDLPPISRCHVYDIQHKFIYKCTKCGQQIGRHSKSLNVERKVCGICHGKFELMINTPKGLTPQAARTPRTPNKFALFVKDNYNSIKQKNTGFKHADIMKALSAEFAAKAKVN